MFLVNSRYRRFAATPVSSRSKSFHQQGHTISRSYGVNLPSSLTWVLSSALVFSTHPPESVWGTVTWFHHCTQIFLEAWNQSLSYLDIAFAFYSYDDCLHTLAGIQSPTQPILLRPCSAPPRWYRNINLFPISFAFRLRLRGRLTRLGLSWSAKPLGFRRRGFSPLLSLLMSAFSLPIAPAVLAAPPSVAIRTLPYHLQIVSLRLR